MGKKLFDALEFNMGYSIMCGYYLFFDKKIREAVITPKY